MIASETYRFGDVTVEKATFRLSRGGVPLHIEPKALEVLIYLIEQRERVVPKQELLDQIWKGTTVTENALTRAIAQIRKVLGDDAEVARYVQTVPTRGYRFVAELRDAVEEPPRPSRPFARVVSRSIAIIIALVIASLLAGLLKGRRPTFTGESQEQPPIPARPLAPSSRLQSFPAFSPDGSVLAYSSDAGGTTHIYRRAIGGGDEMQVTDGNGEDQPSWSPDGKSIAFVSVRHGGIWIVPVAGGEAVQLTTMGSRPAWSPDASEIAFQSGDLIAYGWTAFEAQPPSTISIVNVNTRRAVPLTRPREPAGGHAAPSWRADGKRLAFSSCDLERCAVYTIARDGSGLTEIVTDSRKLQSPVFARDGRALHYVLVRYNNSLLLSVPIDSDGARTGVPKRLRQSDTGVMQHLAISRDGFRLAWTLTEEASDLFAIGVEKPGTPVRLTNNPTLRTTFPAFSPDGTKIAYSVFAAGEDSGVWIADADGRNAKALAVESGLKQYTQWSRGGWDVSYAIWYGSGPAVFKASLITGRASLVTSLPHGASAPVLSPDESQVAFNRTIDGVTSVWISAVSGDGRRRLTEDGDLARFPVWSPSGRQIAMQVQRPDGSSAVAVMPAAGGRLRIVTAARGESWPYSWSPDEKQIAFAARRDGVWNIWTVPAAGGEPRRLTDTASTTIWLRSPAWSPSGDRIVYESDTPKANIWVSEARVTQ
ncbi:MAG TPA: winged helix-turn-helix domain-containing protein [Thermoanaerobaculia bacterium]